MLLQVHSFRNITHVPTDHFFTLVLMHSEKPVDSTEKLTASYILLAS